MKLDAVAQYDNKFSDELFSKAVGHDSDHMTVNTWKADFGSVREHDIASYTGSKGAEDVPQYDNSPSSHCYVDNEASSEVEQNGGKHMEASYSPPSRKSGLARRETDIYSEDNVTEFELPDVITRFTFKDDACHIVKDICIDDGTHSLGKVLVASNEDVRLSSGFNHSVSNGSYSPTKGMTENATEITDYHGPITHGSESSLVGVHPTLATDDDAVQSLSGSSLTDGGSTVAVSLSEANIKQLRPLQEFARDPWKVDPSKLSSINDQKPSFVCQKIDQGTLEEGNSTAKDVRCSVEEAFQSIELKRSPNSDVGVITLHCDSRVASSEGSKEKTDHQAAQDQYIPKHEATLDNTCKGKIDQVAQDQYILKHDEETLGSASKGKIVHQAAQDQYILKHEEADLDSATTSSRRSFVHLGHGDLNFYGPASLSVPTTSSGHIQYSGSTSLRSDSSTTSARSFAFPILQSEWNSSPVKMAKADRRNLRKHRGWRMGLLCCRF